MGHDTRLIPPANVKPFVKRQKNDMADAEAICEAAQRPTMRFVQGKSAEAQASAVVFRTRDIIVGQRTQLINALRGHLTEFGYVVRQGVGHVGKLVEIVRDPTSDIPAEARPILVIIADSLRVLQSQIALLDREIAARAKADPVTQRLMTVPGVGPVIATALVALAPAANIFRRGRDFAAWLGLVPRQHSSGGKERLGRTTKMGERSLRRLLTLGASSVTKVAARDPDKAGAWLAGFWRASRACWSPSRWQTRWRGSSGHWWRTADPSGLRPRWFNRHGSRRQGRKKVDRGMAQRSEDGVENTSEMSWRFERAEPVWTRSVISIQASSRDDGCINRPDTRKHLVPRNRGGSRSGFRPARLQGDPGGDHGRRDRLDRLSVDA